MRIPASIPARSNRKAKLLAQLSLLGVLAGLGAGCSTSAFQLNEPVFTGSTANQQKILANQAASYSTPAPSYASAPAAYPASGSGIQRQALPAPNSVAYAQPSAFPAPGAPQPYTPPKPFAAKGLPMPVGAVQPGPASAQDFAASSMAPSSAPLPVRRGTPPRTLGEQAQTVEATTPPAEVKVASIDPQAPLPAEMAAPATAQQATSIAPVAPQPQAAQPTPAATTASTGAAGFRWPVRGRVISGFGKKASGERNDGINLAVPEGTSVKAAEDGEVIYSGNELKSYGNLILVRHNNGWVSAYAHNSELKVKRGEKIRRGQIVALSGMSGGVTTPQVHFELRKDATPVDPLSHLNEG